MIHVRAAELSDARMLMGLRNDPDAVSASITARPVLPEEHLQWLRLSLSNPLRIMLIGEIDDQELAPMGMCRFDVTDDHDSAEVSINLSPAARGRGLAQSLLRASLAVLQESFPSVSEVRATVRTDNSPSRALFARLGFAAVGADSEYEYLRLTLG